MARRAFATLLYGNSQCRASDNSKVNFATPIHLLLGSNAISFKSLGLSSMERLLLQGLFLCEKRENGTLSEIKKAYKQLARKYHPDVSRWSAHRSVTPERTEEYTKTIIRVQETYETLSDLQTRASYDVNMSKGLHLAFSARKSGQNDQRSDGEWKNRWQAQSSRVGEIEGGSPYLSLFIRNASTFKVVLHMPYEVV
ncbi:hypothetical protein RJ639_021833 [Escallonia herrerae]|uniref:J domain-containing protein n=1 Tax=Escallonia herrerae TaxID=1293975 RepID=A0AA88V570_9ASTE|nr:hypothetical protein RJ639_021833 [Escallonia herrerae]